MKSKTIEIICDEVAKEMYTEFEWCDLNANELRTIIQEVCKRYAIEENKKIIDVAIQETSQ